MANVSAKEIAAEIGVPEKTFRRFVREYMRAKGLGDNLPGRGGRYVFDSDNVNTIAAQYLAWRNRASTSFILFDEDESEDAPENETLA
jgi:hypothetical protein